MTKASRTRRVKHVVPGVPMPVPFGAHVVDHGVQFTVFSRHAVRVWLLLFDDPTADKPSFEVELSAESNRIGDIWHIFLPNARPGQGYVYRMEGPPGENISRFFNPRQWLLDPYALAVAGAPRWGDPHGVQPGHASESGASFPRGLILRDDFDWTSDHLPRTPLNDSVIYEAHLRGYTVHPTSGVGSPGTYRGLVEKIPYLQDLGVTAVELLPIHEFNEMEYFLENMNRGALRNFWGYSTLAFFAPNGRYASGGVLGQQVREFKEMVHALHQAGIEIILDVVFNHTGEGGDGGPTYSFRGIDNDIYYMMEPGREHYANYTGCGNTVNCNHPVVRSFIMNCLRYWVLHMHVDGFRFDLASILTRGPDGKTLANPPAVEQIAEDPALRNTKIIAEAWDASGLYQVGQFPNKWWSEWNGRYRDAVRRFWRGDDGVMRDFVNCLIGSPDLYNKLGQAPQKSINFITCHDGFTLADLVSYEQKRNEANGEENRDGENRNHSMNCGIEGPTEDSRVLALRKRQQKNLFATLFLSQGVPMFPAGDEFARTQQGNNNAYCQDNEISWVDWSLLDRHADLRDFVKMLIAFRRAHPVLRHMRFLNDKLDDTVPPDVRWSGPQDGPVDWDHGLALGCLLLGHVCEPDDRPDDSFFLIFNARNKPVSFAMPDPPGKPWQLAFTTQEGPPGTRKGLLRVAGRTLTVFVSALV
ncbi:MAG: glycogen debranching protein GlgX [Kiritimatiellae bacterium]|nr:glycogen debranching protein GlgX [Kiritimatiellia bacterium]